MKKRIKLISLAVAAGMLISATNVSAYTRQYTFHMNTSYAHGKEPNCGYAATKDDNVAIAYITMTQYKINSGTPQISMWVAPSGTYAQATDAWTWTGTAPRKSLGYNRAVKKGMAFQLCAEQFGSGRAVIGGRWTP